MKNENEKHISLHHYTIRSAAKPASRTKQGATALRLTVQRRAKAKECLQAAGVGVSDEVYEALAATDGVTYSPVAILATQTVNGTNYCILAYGRSVTAVPSTDLYVLTVYVGTDGSSAISNAALLDLQAYVTKDREEEPDYTDSSEPENTDESSSESASDSSEPDSTSDSSSESSTASSADSSKASGAAGTAGKNTNPSTGTVAFGVGALTLAAGAVTVISKRRK